MDARLTPEARRERLLLAQLLLFWSSLSSPLSFPQPELGPPWAMKSLGVHVDLGLSPCLGVTLVSPLSVLGFGGAERKKSAPFCYKRLLKCRREARSQDTDPILPRGFRGCIGMSAQGRGLTGRGRRTGKSGPPPPTF